MTAPNMPRFRTDAGPGTAYPWTMAAILAGVALLAFANGIRGVFLWDDLTEVVHNPAFERAGLTLNSFTVGVRRAPWILPALSYVADRKLWGFDAGGYHLTNLLIHVVAVLALFDLCRSTLRRRKVSPILRDRATAVAAAIAALWAVHPLQTQVVTYLAGRPEAIGGMASLVSLAAFARAGPEPAGRGWIVVCVLSAGAAMLAGQSALGLPVALMTYDWCVMTVDFSDFRSRWRRHSAIGATWLLAVAQLLLQRWCNPYLAPAPFSSREYAGAQPEIILHYLLIAVWPYDQQLVYDWPLPDGSWRWAAQYAIVSILLIVVAAAVGRRSAWGWLGVCFFVFLLPTSGLTALQALVDDSRFHLPLASVIALIICFGIMLLAQLEPPPSEQGRLAWPTLAAVGALILIAWMAMLTYSRNALFHDRVAFWSHLVDQDPTNSVANSELAAIYAASGDAAEALASARVAMASDPTNAVFTRIGAIFLLRGQDALADTAVREGIDRQLAALPTDCRPILIARQTHAAMLFDRKRLEEAATICTAQIAAMDHTLGPGHDATLQARTMIIYAALAEKRFADAEDEGRKNLAAAVAAAGPGSPITQEAAVPLVRALYATDRGAEAETLLRDLIESASAMAWRQPPDLRVAWRTLAGMLESEGRFDQAVEARQAVLVECVERLGDYDPQTIRASALRDAAATEAALGKGDIKAAEQNARRGLGLALAAFGAGDPLSQSLVVRLANIAMAQDDMVIAERLLREYLDQVAYQAKSAGGGPIDATKVQKALAAVLEKTGRVSDAVRIRRLILQFLLKIKGPDDGETQEAARMLEAVLQPEKTSAESQGPP